MRRDRHAAFAFCFALALGCALTLGAPARAQTPAHKFGRGMSNLALGIMELPANIDEEARRHGFLSAASLGFARGMGMWLTRELVGLYEVVTFPAPAPRGYKAIMRPEYPWQLFD